MSQGLAGQVGVLGVPGFRAMGVPTGVKKGRPDLALIVSDVKDTAAAGLFTQNAFAAAPVHICKQHLANGKARAIVVNAGNANACTGRQGLRDALTMTEATGKALGIDKDDVLICSTGIIGRPMPMDKILPGIDQCVAALDDAVGGEAAHAILTTDSGPKETHRAVEIDGRQIHISGIAKGAGMIHPNMATMLAFLVTDAPVPPKHLGAALKEAVDASFNQITVDGDTSTNDTVLVLANGLAGGDPIKPGSASWEPFVAALTDACTDLGRRIAADGEGATKLLTVIVEGARSTASARAMARAVASSNLVKSALYGEDPNWGRIVAAVGKAEPTVIPSQVTITVEGQTGAAEVLREGEPTGMLDAAHNAMGGPEVTFRIHVGAGQSQGMAWGCDLTEEYVSFNAEYST